MAIYTPQGLLIRLDLATSFGLMARLYPTIRPTQILKTTEDISLMSSALGFITGLFCFVLQLSPQSMGICTLIAIAVGILLSSSGLIYSPFVQLGAVYNRIYVGFLPIIISIVVGYFLTGWQGVTSYLLTRCIAACLSMIVGMGLTRQSVMKMGYALTTVERNFFHAYRYHAEQLGKSRKLELSFEELNETFWHVTYLDYLQSNPKKVERLGA